jgi:DNA-binding transcriptional LysR family regulator
VNLANLRLIRDVAHHHSVSKAARLNDLSQSAASQALSELERELGTLLFDRCHRPLRITPAGKLYLEYCRDVLRRHDELQASLDVLKDRVNGTVRVASIYSVGLSEMSEIEARFAERFPDAELTVQYLRPERVWDAVVHDQADLGLMSYAESSREVVALPWRDEEMVVACAPDHALAIHESVRISAIAGQAFVGFDDDLPIQGQIDRYLREHRVEVDITLRFDNIEMIKQAVAHGAGVSIMPERVMREDMLQGRLMALRLEPAELYRPVRIVHRRRKVFNEVTAGLLEMLKEEEKSHAA